MWYTCHINYVISFVFLWRVVRHLHAKSGKQLKDSLGNQCTTNRGAILSFDNIFFYMITKALLVISFYKMEIAFSNFLSTLKRVLLAWRKEKEGFFKIGFLHFHFKLWWELWTSAPLHKSQTNPKYFPHIPSILLLLIFLLKIELYKFVNYKSINISYYL